jgi:hypothetical protein
MPRLRVHKQTAFVVFDRGHVIMAREKFGVILKLGAVSAVPPLRASCFGTGY